MTKNNNLNPIPLPMPVRFGLEPQTEFKTLEKELKVTLVQGPTEFDIERYAPGFVNATWAEDITEYERYTAEKKFESVVKMFKGKTLPGVLETLRFTFILDGMTLQEVTHILRHRNATFSAVCTGDRFMYNDDVIIPEAITQSPEFYDRYKELALAQKKLYTDLVNSKEVSLMDARYVLPKATRQTYYMSINYKDLLGFVFQRIDRAIQPKGSNILAYKMWLEVCRQLPILAALKIVDFNAPSRFFINTARSGHSTNLYIPEAHNDKFEWNEKDFIYQKQREELIGTDENAESTFPEILDQSMKELEDIGNRYMESLTAEEAAVIKQFI